MEDLINRQAAIKAICEDSTWLESQGCTDIWMAERKQRDVDILSGLPSVQPERKNGRWIPGREIGKEILTDGTIEVAYEDYKCSSCGLILFRLLHNSDGTPFYKFCPNCGADMRGEQNG